MSRPPANSPENRRIDSWKEIAAFFGRDERTAKRWEKERGLPVHRLPGERGGVFAWSHELLEWLNSSVSPAPLSPPAPTPDSKIEKAPSRSRNWLDRSVVWTAAATFVLVGALVTGVAIPGKIRSSIASVRASAPFHHIPDREAEQLYLKGRYYWSRRTSESLNLAVDAFTQAVVHDSNYAQAYAGLAECYDLMPEYGSLPASEAFPRAISAAHKAIALDDSLGEAHRALGFALFYGEWKVPAGLEEYQRALALDSRDEEAHHWYATSLLALGRMTEARAEIDRAQQLNPASRSILCDQALIHFFTGEQAAAVAKLVEIEQAEPEFLSAPRYLAYAAFTRKDYHTFIEQSKRSATLSGSNQLLKVAEAAERGLNAGSEHGMLEAMRIVQRSYFERGQSSGFDLARTCALLGRNQDAIAALNAAMAAHDYSVLGTSMDPNFNSLSGDPAFQDLVRRITERAYQA
ncbi:hypothetical protein DYQ86_14395 [Acidobacteria bacterium AB60]|nr:hypothetical protein DYQ86_14395 [Acidobacteria bacterium AB60]